MLPIDTLGPLFILFGFGLVLATFAFVIWAVVDAARTPDARWNAAGQNKALWLAIIIGVAILGGGLGWLGALLYVLVARKAMRQPAH